MVSKECWSAGGHPRTTNNLMELRAVFEALNATPRSRPLAIETDSEYVINIFTKWIEGWKGRGWQTAANRPVANQAAIREVERLLHGRHVEWRHVKGHSGHELNELADGHAREAAVRTRDGGPVVEGPGGGCLEPDTRGRLN